MALTAVTISDLGVGLPVEYRGDANPNVVLSEPLRTAGVVLFSGHPGRVWSTTVQHVQVTWVGLEDEPATYAVGFSVNSPEDDLRDPRDADRGRIWPQATRRQ